MNENKIKGGRGGRKQRGREEEKRKEGKREGGTKARKQGRKIFWRHRIPGIGKNRLQD